MTQIPEHIRRKAKDITWAEGFLDGYSGAPGHKSTPAYLRGYEAGVARSRQHFEVSITDDE